MRLRSALLGLLAAISMAGPAMAEFPDKPIRIMAPYAPGGNIDVTARIIADRARRFSSENCGFFENGPSFRRRA